MKTQIFAYKGNLAAVTDLVNGVFINSPLSAGQLGCVVSTKEVEISQEAINLIKKAHREGGSFAEIMLTRHSDNTGSSIALMGRGFHHFGKEFQISRDCDLSVLQDATLVPNNPPEDYKSFIDNPEVLT